MRNSFMRVMLAVSVATIVTPVRAQIPAPAAAPPQGPPAAYVGSTYQPYSFDAPTPQDAYRQGLINRWELEQVAGPTPQALQGPSADDFRGTGGDGKGN